MDVTARNPNRAKALAASLSNGLNGPVPSSPKPSMAPAERSSEQLRGWAMWQLTSYFAAAEMLDREDPSRFEATFPLKTLHKTRRAYGR